MAYLSNENYLLIGQKDYSIIFSTNWRGCKKNSLKWSLGILFSKPYHNWRNKMNISGSYQSEIILEGHSAHRVNIENILKK